MKRNPTHKLEGARRNFALSVLAAVVLSVSVRLTGMRNLLSGI